MRFYTEQHQYYCGVDLHARSLYVCILDQRKRKVFHRGIPASPEAFLDAVAPYMPAIVVAAECMFCWYWLSDVCQDNGIPFVLGHALYMKAIHGAKAKNDRIDSRKIAALLAGGALPMAYTYPREMRATRDVLRRRGYYVHHRSEAMAHIRNTAWQYNLPQLAGRLDRPEDAQGIIEHFPDPSVQKSIGADVAVIEQLGQIIGQLEWHVEKTAREHNSHAVALLRTVPGIGKVLALTILYEIDTVARFPRVQEFLSYGRLVTCAHESGGKLRGAGGRKIGNVHLKWAFSEAATLFLRGNPRAQKLRDSLEKKHGKGKALSILARRLATAVYYMLKRKETFRMDRFFAAS
jgi:transposase